MKRNRKYFQGSIINYERKMAMQFEYKGTMIFIYPNLDGYDLRGKYGNGTTDLRKSSKLNDDMTDQEKRNVIRSLAEDKIDRIMQTAEA